MTAAPDRGDPYQSLLGFLVKLSERSIYYSLSPVRPEAIMVVATVPGERWEVEFLVDGSIEVEVFRSDGTIREQDALDELFAFGEDPSASEG